MLEKAVALSKGLRDLRAQLTDQIVTKVFMPLKNSPLGFVTDEKEKQYTVPEVREAIIQGLIWGLQPVGNEINIISGRCYAAKAGVERLVRQWPKLSCLQMTFSVPVMAQDGRSAFVSARASWLIGGKKHELIRDTLKNEDGTMFDSRIAVRVNSGMGPDAILGKAQRKTYKAILDQLTNGSISIDDADAIETTGVVVEQAQIQEGQRMKLGAKPQPAPMREPGED
jgi:hypothetical protein